MQFPRKMQEDSWVSHFQMPSPQKKPAFRSYLSLAQTWHPEIHEGIRMFRGTMAMAEDWGTKGPTIFFAVSWY